MEEWYGIDLLAIAAWSKPRPARTRHERIGYEVKISRSDYRRELLRPSKRSTAVRFCHEFYFAVPDGLLRPEEIEWDEPEWVKDWASFSRVPCPSHCRRQRGESKTGRGEWTPRPATDPGYDAERSWTHTVEVWRTCEECGGRGYLAQSRIETEAPTLWVPADVGLITVSARGCRVMKPSPMNDPSGSVTDRLLGDLVRWASFRPDPRHHANGASSESP